MMAGLSSGEETDLTYEGIETLFLRMKFVKFRWEETDLTYEGIETSIPS